MKTRYQNIDPIHFSEVVQCSHIKGERTESNWHFHEEMELTLVVAGKIQRCIGDDISMVLAGDLVLMGSNLPHCYTQASQATSGVRAELLQLKFKPALLGAWLQMSDLAPLAELFRQSTCGVLISGQTRDQVAVLMTNLMKAEGLKRLIYLLEILHKLSHTSDVSQISSSGFALDSQSSDKIRVGRITRYVQTHMNRPMYIKDVAKHVGMSSVSLSRYLRNHLQKTFPTFVNELRIARVCHLLGESDATISEIAVHCGFDSMANFERQFRKLKHCSPKVFRKRCKQVIPTMDTAAKKEFWNTSQRVPSTVAA